MRLLSTGLLITLLWAGVCSAEEAYHWPMDAKPALTSTFGEYRPGRFHAGVDLKTWGQEGFPVLAVSDGYIWRIRTSPWGYGRVVYIKLKDRRTAVYAHLSRFVPAITALVEAEQDRRGNYSVNLFLKENQLPVSGGEIVGYSGSTGIGVPHLHFELRDDSQRPMNALIHGFPIKDTLPPTIRSVALIPMGPGSRVDGGYEPRDIGVRWIAREQGFVSNEILPIEGKIGVAVRVFDRADASELTNRLAPYRLRLLVDSREVFQTDYGIFAYDQVGQVELDRNFALNQRGAGRFHNLYRKTGNSLPMYGNYRIGHGILFADIPAEEAGISLSPGPHRIRVIAEDQMGNRSEAILGVKVGQQPRVSDARAETGKDSVNVTARVWGKTEDSLEIWVEVSTDQGSTWASEKLNGEREGDEIVRKMPKGDLFRVRVRNSQGLESFQTCAPFRAHATAPSSSMISSRIWYYPTFAVVEFSTDRILAGPPRVTARWKDGKTLKLSVRQNSFQTYRSVLKFDPKRSDVVTLAVSGVGKDGEAGHLTLYLDQQRVLNSDGGVVRSQDGAAAAHFSPDQVYQTIFGRVEVDSTDQDGQVYSFMPEDVPFKGEVTLSMQFPRNSTAPEHLGVYRKKDADNWEFVGNDINNELQSVSAKVKHFSTYRLMSDDSPPTLSRLIPMNGAEIVDRKPRLSANLHDEMSGIGRETDISMRLDGATIIFEYDPENDIIFGYPRQDIEPGYHQLEVSVRDMSGNDSKMTSSFLVR